MKVLLIGTVVKDIIKYLDGTEVYAYGGLTHSINAALAVSDPGDRIIAMSWVGKDLYPDIQRNWQDNPRLLNEGFLRYSRINNCVELSYISKSERIERSLYPMPSLRFEDVKRFLNADMIIVNLISGWDITRKFIEKLREKFKGLISLDIHSLTLGRAEDGTRFLRPVNEIKPWLESADIVQMNSNEYEMISGNTKEPEDFFARTCAKSKKIINLTNGRHGSKVLIINNDQIKSINMKSARNVNVIDPTGCGDTYLAAFGITYFKTGDVSVAAKRANLAAALTGSIKGSPKANLLRNKLDAHTMEDE